jgi:predicted XRE-type DNA-binding protein
MDGDIVASTGNVFEDLALPDAQARLAKAELARRVSAIIAERRLTQVAAADALDIDQPKVSALMNGRLAGFSIERLMHFLTLLGQDVEIIIRGESAARSVGALTVRRAG